MKWMKLSLLCGPMLTYIHDCWENQSFNCMELRKVTSVLFNMLSRLVITFLPRSKCLLISWWQSPSAVTLEPRKIKFDTVSPFMCQEVMGPYAVMFIF